MKSERDRGRWGSWLRAKRLQAGKSPEQVRELLAARGYRVGESTYAEWESGYKKQPAKDAMPHLIALWGEPPAEAAPEPVGDIAALLMAIEKQTDLLASQWQATLDLTQAITGLVEAVREDRDRISPEGVRLFLRSLLSEGLIALPEALPAEVTSTAEPHRQVSGR